MFWLKKKRTPSKTDTFPFQIENGKHVIESIKNFLINKHITKTREDEDLYDKSINKEDYFSQIQKGVKLCEIPLCWFESGQWYMLSGFFIKEDDLFAEIYDLQTGPPDFGYMRAEGVPIRVLLESYKILIMQY